MHEAHEAQLYVLLDWLEASNTGGNEIVHLASQMQLELYCSERCLLTSPKEDCFGVQIMFNGKPLEFEGVCADPAFCTYPEFT